MEIARKLRRVTEEGIRTFYVHRGSPREGEKDEGGLRRLIMGRSKTICVTFLLQPFTVDRLLSNEIILAARVSVVRADVDLCGGPYSLPAQRIVPLTCAGQAQEASATLQSPLHDTQ
eukprot:768772-Hanusia_phi.AAC.9